MNLAEKLEKQIKKLVSDLDIKIIYKTQTEIFEIDIINLYKIISKIDNLSLKLYNTDNLIKDKYDENINKELYNEKLQLENKNLKLENENLKLKNLAFQQLYINIYTF